MSDHSDLCARAARWLAGTKKCSLVYVEQPCSLIGEIPDAIGFTWHTCIVVECKVSRADFFADKRKVHREIGLGEERYYLVPEGLIQPHEVPPEWGLLWACERIVRVKRKAAPRGGRASRLGYERTFLYGVALRQSIGKQRLGGRRETSGPNGDMART